MYAYTYTYTYMYMYMYVCVYVYVYVYVYAYVYVCVYVICTYTYLIWLVIKTVSLANDLWISGQVLLQHCAAHCAFALRSQSCLRHSQVSRYLWGLQTLSSFHNSGGSASFFPPKSVCFDLLGTFLSSCRLLETLNLMANIADSEHHNVSRQSIPKSRVPMN